MTAFFNALLEHAWLYAASVLLCGLGYLLAVRRSAVSWFDPWVAQQVLSAFASASVLFMWAMEIIGTSVAIYHLLAVGGFLAVAAWVFRVRSSTAVAACPISASDVARLRAPVFAVFLVSQGLAWTITGIPVLLESRLDAFATGGGAGVLSRILAFTSTGSIFLSVVSAGAVSGGRFRARDVAVVGAILVASILGGSKSSILFTPLFILTSDVLCRRLFQSQYSPLTLSRKTRGVLLAAFLAFMMIPVVIEASRVKVGELEAEPVEAIAVRLVLSGDGYMWCYGDGYIDTMSVDHPFALLFADVLGMTRLASWDELPTHPGLALYRELTGDMESIRGPNLRVDLFGLVLGSMVAGVFFSCLLGAVFGASRALMFRAKTVPGMIAGVFLFMNAPALLVDPVLGITVLVNGVLGYLVLWLCWRLLLATGSLTLEEECRAS